MLDNASVTEPVKAGQLSPDGRFRWDGGRWIYATPTPTSVHDAEVSTGSIQVAGSAKEQAISAAAIEFARSLGSSPEIAVQYGQRAAQINVDISADANQEEIATHLLLDGCQPPSLTDAPFVLDTGELLHARTQCEAWAWHAVTPKKGSAWVGGLNPVGLVLLVISLVVNVVLASKRRHEAEAKWRPLGTSVLCVTNRRVLRKPEGGSQWNAYPLSAIKNIELSTDKASVVVKLAGKESTPFAYRLSGAPMWIAMLTYLANGQATRGAEA